MITRSEPCGCHGSPHRRLIVETIHLSPRWSEGRIAEVQSEKLTLLSVCEWALWLMRQLWSMNGLRDPCWDALVAAGLEPTEPDPAWREALAAMDD